MDLFITKPVSPGAQTGEPENGSATGEATLTRTLTAGHLVLLGIGAVVGAGIFVVTGQAAAFHAFATVCIGLLVLRMTKPDLPRAFRVPMAPVVCLLGAATCLWLFMRAFEDNWRWMTAWIIVGLLIYFGYGYRNSVLRKRGR